MGAAAFVILLLGVVALAARMMLVQESVHASVEFGTLVLNIPSLLWLGLILARTESFTNARFGAAMRRESPALMIALMTSVLYSVGRLIGIVLPWTQGAH